MLWNSITLQYRITLHYQNLVTLHYPKLYYIMEFQNITGNPLHYQKMPAKQGIHSVHRCEATNMAAKCKIFVPVILHLIGICKNKYDWQTRNA